MIETNLIDAHCHLDFESFDNDRAEVLQRATDNNISDIVIPGTQKKYWDRVRELCKTSLQLHACYGLHPYWVEQHNIHDLKLLDEYIETNRPVAVGECGLDFRPQQADRETQIKFFEAQLTIAQRHRLPVVVHAVNATETVIQTLKRYDPLTGMIHSYSGSSEQARQLIDRGFYISVGGSVTYDRASKIKKIVTQIPLTSLLIETDAPDQPDQLHQSERNEPSFLINIAQQIATLRKEEINKIIAQTTINAKTLFNI